MHTQKQTHSQIHKQTYIHTYAHTHTTDHKQTHIHTCAHTHTRYTNTQTNTQTNTHVRTRTHAQHIHTQQILPFSGELEAKLQDMSGGDGTESNPHPPRTCTSQQTDHTDSYTCALSSLASLPHRVAHSLTHICIPPPHTHRHPPCVSLPCPIVSHILTFTRAHTHPSPPNTTSACLVPAPLRLPGKRMRVQGESSLCCCVGWYVAVCSMLLCAVCCSVFQSDNQGGELICVAVYCSVQYVAVCRRATTKGRTQLCCNLLQYVVVCMLQYVAERQPRGRAHLCCNVLQYAAVYSML